MPTREDEYLERARRARHRVGPPAADQRRAARRLPLRRHRLERGRRRDGRDRAPARVVTTSVGFDEQAFNELEYARDASRSISAPSQHETIVHARHRRSAAEARVALRRAVRRFVGRADLLRVEGGARARDGRAVGRRRRRAVGRLRAASRRAVGADGAALARAGRRHASPGGSAGRAAARREGRAVAAPPGAARRPTPARASTPTACSSRMRATRCTRATSRSAVRDADPFAGFRARLRRVPVDAIRSTARSTWTSRRTSSTTS